MTFEKFGNEKNKTIFFIEGMATTAHSCFDKILPYLEDFYVIYCNLDGHYDGSASFK